MAVIAFVSPKGGVGKTTAAVLLACELAERADVILLDADPNQPIRNWARLDNLPPRITVWGDVTQETIIDHIEDASSKAPFVIVDCEGTASLTVAYAIGQADLVIVPSQGSHLDAKQAARALSVIRIEEKRAKRPIAHGVLLTRTNPKIRTRSLAHVANELKDHGVHVLHAQLDEREAFRAIFGFGGSIRSLDPSQVANLEKAIKNAAAFATEVVGMLREAMSHQAEGAVR